MVSVKRFIHDEPLLFKASKAFVALLFRCADPIVYVASKLPNRNEQIAWTLLGSALFQDRTYPDILRLLCALHEKFPGDKLWSLPVPKASEIEEVVERTFNSRNWTAFEHVAGIFWSVGLFVRHHPDLAAWVREHTPEELWNDLGEIYFMGRSNPRPKACAAIYRLTAPQPLGLGLEYCGDAVSSGRSNLANCRRFRLRWGPAAFWRCSDLRMMARFRNWNRKKNRNWRTNILKLLLLKTPILRLTRCSSFLKMEQKASFAVN